MSKVVDRGLPLSATSYSAGDLMFYRWNSAHRFVPVAPYIDRIPRSASPTDLPVQKPTGFSLVIKLKTAKELDPRSHRLSSTWLQGDRVAFRDMSLVGQSRRFGLIVRVSAQHQ